MLMRCTRKVLKDLRMRDADLVEEDSNPEADWFANWIRIDRRKCVMFTHSTTLYVFLVKGAVRKDFDRFDDYFLEHLREMLTADFYPQDVVDRMILSLGTISYGKTNSRSVLGHMNDYDSMARHMIWRTGGLASCNLIELSLELNESPLVNREIFNAERGMRQYMERYLPSDG